MGLAQLKQMRDRLGAERKFDNGSKSAEYGVIGCMLKNSNEYNLWEDAEEAFGLKPAHFFDDLMAKAYECGISIAKRNENVNFISLSAEICHRSGRLANDVEREISLALQTAGDEITQGRGVEGWIKLVQAKFQDRMLSMAGSIVQGMPSSDDGRTKEFLIAEAKELLAAAEAAAPDFGTPIKSAKQIMQTALDEILEAKRVGTGMTGLSTGFTELDKLTQGFKSQELIIIAARPSMGKTALALTMMHDVAENQKKHTYFVSLEMGEGQIGARYLALEADVTMHRMRTGTITDYDEKTLRNVIAKQDDVGYFHFDETPSMTAQQICSHVRKEHTKYAIDGGLGMVVIDYIGLVTEVGRANDSKSDRIGEISRSLKQLSRELKIPIVALAQLNRSVEKRQDKRPMMSDLRDSGSIEQDADVVIFLYRDEIYNTNSIDVGVAEVIVTKQRNGGLGTVRVAFEGQRARFTDISEPSISHPKTMTIDQFRNQA